MEFPGITKKRIGELEPKIQKVVRTHLADVRGAIRAKEEILANRDPNEKFLGFRGFRQLEKYSANAKGALKGDLADLKTAVNRLRASIDHETALVRDLDALTKGAQKDKTLQEELLRLKEELDDELYVARLLRQQLDYMSEAHECAAKISKTAGPEISAYVSELDDICGVLKGKINEELEYLGLIYNFLNVPGWEELKEELEG